MKTINKTFLVTAVAAAVTAAIPQMAGAAGHGGVSSSSAQSSLERRLQMMEQELQSLRSELARTRAETQSEVKANSERIEANEQKVDQKIAEVEEHKDEHHSLLFFRGGYAAMEHARNQELLLNNSLLNPTIDDPKNGDGWYVGAGFDHDLTDDMWGLWDGAEVDGEVMFEYKNFGTSYNALVGNYAGVQIENQLTQFTLTAAPKIKFNNILGGDLRPWIIPFGLGLHVISPPSSGVTVLNPGLMLGVGTEYRIWKQLYAGLDFRYHFTGDDLSYKTTIPGVGTVLNKTDIDGFTTGAYLGFGF